MGLGVAVLGRSIGRPELIALGMAGALLHTWNHGLFKALLFLSAGSVLHATGTRQIDRLGGLWRRMPRTATAFLIGAVAICGLPPLNGLISELFVYLGLFRACVEADSHWLVGALGAPALALIGALALACFVKVFGAVFLGQARTEDVEHAHEAGPSMLVPMAVLAAGCLCIGLGAPVVSRVLDVAVAGWVAEGAAASLPALSSVAPLGWISAIGAVLLGALVACCLWLVKRARDGTERTGAAPAGTWDCGYAAPAARMQYTASSFAGLVVGLLSWALRPIAHGPNLVGPFPAPSARFDSHVPDTVLDRGIVPSFSLAARILARLRPIQQGSVHLYLLYILGTLLVLLLWR
jgi:hydrogenase-4 component B